MKKKAGPSASERQTMASTSTGGRSGASSRRSARRPTSSRPDGKGCGRPTLAPSGLRLSVWRCRSRSSVRTVTGQEVTTRACRRCSGGRGLVTMCGFCTSGVSHREAGVTRVFCRTAACQNADGLHGHAMSPPARPAAATLVLLRDRPAGPAEILLVQRHGRSKFAAGDHVFAGGKVEADDIPDDVERFCRGLTATEASARLGGDLTPRQALGYWVGAIREAFEEVGILLAYDRTGAFVRRTPDNRARFEAHRQACQSANPAFLAMLRAEELTLATDRLTYFAHWITPEEQPLRFDTRFFATEAPPGQEPEVDGHEIVASRWLTAAEAFEALARKEITLRLPTIKNLELLQRAGGRTADVLSGLLGLTVPTIRPRVLQVDGKPLAVLPGDLRWY